MTSPSPRGLRRAGLALVAAIISVAAAFVLLPLAVRGALRVLDLTLTGLIWLTTSVGSDADAWTIVRVVGGALFGALVSAKALAFMGALVLVSALALYGIQRLLGLNEEL